MWPPGRLGKIASRQGRLWCAEFSPDGRTLVTSSADGSVRMWDSLLDRDRIALRIPSPVVHSMSFSADGKTICSRPGTDGRIWSWDANRGIPLAHPAIRARQGHKESSVAGRSTLATIDSNGESGSGKFRMAVALRPPLMGNSILDRGKSLPREGSFAHPDERPRDFLLGTKAESCRKRPPPDLPKYRFRRMGILAFARWNSRACHSGT